MHSVSVRLPPLNALRAFGVVARCSSIREASEELLVTPQAVSQQIKLLEDVLGVKLLDRKGRAIALTEDGIVLSSYVNAGLEEFFEGVRRITKKRYKDRITLNVSPYFATRYLLPRIEELQNTISDSDLRMTTMVDMPDFARDDIDAAIQWGYGYWASLESTLLIKDYKVICCNKEVAARIHEFKDLLNEKLLHPIVKNSLWSDILNFLEVSDPDDTPKIAFHDAATMRRATQAGMGVGLISRIDAEHDLKIGELVAPFGIDVIEGMPQDKIPGFYLVLPKSHRRFARIAKFCDLVVKVNWEQTDGSD